MTAPSLGAFFSDTSDDAFERGITLRPSPGRIVTSRQVQLDDPRRVSAHDTLRLG